MSCFIISPAKVRYIVKKFIFTQMKEKVSKALRLLSKIGIALLIFLCTGLLISYSRGYDFDFTSSTFNKTGALSITATEFRSEIRLNGDDEGRTPKSFTSLKPGIYNIEIERANYYTWMRNVEVYPEKNTPVNAVQFLQKPDKSTVFKLDSNLVHLQKSSNDNYIYMITSSSTNSFQENFKVKLEDETASMETVELTAEQNSQIPDISSKPIKIWRFNSNQSFWDLRANPVLIYEEQIQDLETVKLLPSPDGNSVLFINTVFTVIPATEDQPELNSKEVKYYLLNGNSFNSSLNELQLTQVLPEQTEDFKIEWAKDNKHLLIFSPTQIFALDTETKTTQEVFTQTDRSYTAFTTDGDGEIYIAVQPTVNPETEGSTELLETPATVVQMTLGQASEKTVLENLPGNIKKVYSFPDVEIMLTQTESSLLFHDLDASITKTLSSTPAQFISISPDEFKILYHDSSKDSLVIYTFDKDQGDPTVEIGDRKTIKVSDKINPQNVFWGASSDYLTYIDNGNFNTTDIYGYNNLKLVELENNFAATNGGSDKLYTFEYDGQYLNLNLYTLR